MSLKKKIDETNKEIAALVLTSRTFAGLGQIEFSKLLGISQPQLSKIENGIAFMTAAQYMILLDTISKLGVKK